MFGEVKNTIRSSMGALYLYLWLWGNKRRFEEEKLRREIEDENDILKEEFDRRKLLKILHKSQFIYRAKWNQKFMEFKSSVILFKKFIIKHKYI